MTRVARRPRRARRARVARRPKRWRKPKRPGVQLHPVRQERAYARKLVAVVGQARSLLDKLVPPRLGEIERAAGVRADEVSWTGALAALFITIRARMDQELSEAHLEKLASDAGRDVAGYNKIEMTRQLRASVGIDIFLVDAGLAATVAGFTKTNVALIKTIPSRYFDQVEKIIGDGFRKGQRAAQFAPKIEARFGVTERRARFIARDQVAKLNGQLTENRQTELGIDEYIWRTSRDERVRESHRALEGTRHKWDEPPVVDGQAVHPGESYNCRCSSEPVIPGIAAIKTSPKDVPRDPELVASLRRRQRARA